ncbi:MAG: amino acid ABC transporter substrate-binding protein [Desulfobacteraceae bacterium]|nr:amino acid ABC transporter substrate-binding protein [Desulfobacteraceae bacterium]
MGASMTGKVRVHGIYRTVLCCLILLCVAGCDRGENIKIGFAGSLTGRFSGLGVDARDGVVLAMEEINRKGGINGIPVELVVGDDRSDSSKVVEVDRKLIDSGVVAIIGHMTSVATLAALPQINREKIVMISPTASSEELSGRDDYFFRVVNSSRYEAEKLGVHAVEKMGLKNPACLFDLTNRSFTEDWCSYFTVPFGDAGAGRNIAVTGFEPREDSPYLGLARELLHHGADCLAIAANAVDTAMICQQLRKLKVDIPIFLSGWASTKDLVEHGGASVEGVMFLQRFDRMSQDPIFLDFKKAFVKRFDREPDFGAVNAYETVQVLFSALALAQGDRELKDRIKSIETFRGLQSAFRFDRFGEALHKSNLIVVRNGRFVTIDRL